MKLGFIDYNTRSGQVLVKDKAFHYVLSSRDKKDYDNIKNIVPEWADLERLFITRCFTAMEDRIFSLLSLSAEERYNLLFAQHPKLFNQVPLNYLASMLGMTPETFSRIRNNKLK